MKWIILSILALSSICTGAQVKKDIKSLNGIWIAVGYYNSFEQTKSAIVSRKAFEPNDPVGLRINSKEIKGGKINIGYATLHRHNIHPEVSKYEIMGNDTIKEQGFFEVNLRGGDSLGFFETSDIYYFNYEWKSYISWDVNDSSITLYRPKNDRHEEKSIKYVRVKSSFDSNYPFPNPLYYYVRNRTIVGDYTLKDSTGMVLTKKLNILDDGTITGYEDFIGLKAYFSTDVYCGPREYDDRIIFCEDVLKQGFRCFGFYFIRSDENTIQLFESEPMEKDGRDGYVLTLMKFELIPNN